METENLLLKNVQEWFGALQEKTVIELRQRFNLADDEIQALFINKRGELVNGIAFVVSRELAKARGVADNASEADRLPDSFSLDDEEFMVVVNYSLSIEETLALDHYPNVSELINSRNFPTGRIEKKVGLKMKPFCWDNRITADNAICQMENEGYRPAEVRDLISFGISYPNEQLEHDIVALGQKYKHYSAGVDTVVILCEGGRNQRRIALIRYEGRFEGGEWPKGVMFLGVRKE